MDLAICNWDTAKFLIFSGNVFDRVIYYSHFVAFLFPLLFGFFIILKDRKSYLNKMLVFIIVSFLTYVFFDLILWATEKDGYVMFFCPRSST